MIEALVGVLGVLLGAWMQRYFYREDVLRKEREEKLAVARAVLFEIDDFYRYYLRDPRDFLQRLEPQYVSIPEIKSVEPNPFPVYVGNAGKLGGLDENLVEGIVHFYGAAASYVAVLRDYKTAKDLPWGGLDFPDRQSQLTLALTLLRQMKEALPELISLCYSVCSDLCTHTGLAFEPPRIAVAAEKLGARETLPQKTT